MKRAYYIKELKETKLTDIMSEKEARKAYWRLKREDFFSYFWFFGQIISIDWQAKTISLIMAGLALHMAGISYQVIDPIEVF